MTLVDCQLGSVEFTDGKWLGFQGRDLEAILSFDKYTDIRSVSLGLLSKSSSWIFLPDEIIVLASLDGISYSLIGKKSTEEIQKLSRNGRVEINVGITPAKTKYLKVLAKNIGICPSGHSGEGEPAWLFVDEIIVE